MQVLEVLEVVMALPRAITRSKEMLVPIPTEVVRTQDNPSPAFAVVAPAVPGRNRKTLILPARRLVKHQRTPARTLTKQVDPALLHF